MLEEDSQNEKKEQEGENPKKEKKQKINFYHVLFFAIIPIIIVSVLVGKSIYMTMLPLKYEMEVGADLLNTGLTIIGIAVSVWVGINISNLVDRQLIESLKEKVDLSEKTIAKQKKRQEALEKDLESTNIDIENKFYKMQFLNELIKTRFLYESSGYFLVFFEKTDEQFDYKSHFQIESYYCLCTDAYEHNEWKNSFDYACIGLKQLESFENLLFEEYFQLRKGDFLFYKNVSRTHGESKSLGEFNVEEMEESIQLYTKAGTSHKLDVESEEKNKILGYIYNTMGYSYDLLSQHRKGSKNESEENRKKREEKINQDLRDAKYCMDMAVRNNPKGRYYRNWGLTYQHSGEFEKAKECYLTAFNGNPKDYKAYNNLLALTLRIVDSKLEIEERYKTENGKLLSEFCNASEKIDNTLVADLEWTNEYREFAEKGNFWFEDIHYNICKMYMYFYILSDYKEEEYIRQAIKFCEKALVINQSSLGAKFCLRNAYEAAGDIAKAIEINDQLKIANNGKPVGDSVEIGEMYERRK